MTAYSAKSKLLVNPHIKSFKTARTRFEEPAESNSLKNIWQDFTKSRSKVFKKRKAGFLSPQKASFAHQITALILITLGVLLIFQNFGAEISINTFVKAQLDDSQNSQIEADLINLNKTKPALNLVIVDTSNFKQPQDKLLEEQKIAEAEKNIQTAKPTTKTITIKQGDTISSIALKYGVTIAEILDLNNIKDSAKIRVGLQLLVPIKTSKSAVK
jgi:LysM repeat protein